MRLTIKEREFVEKTEVKRIPEEEIIKLTPKQFDISIISKLDLKDLRILKKFYFAEDSLGGTKGWCQPILLKRLNSEGMKIARTTLEYRLKTLAEFGLIKRVEKTNPVIYNPIDEYKPFVRKVMLTLLAKAGFDTI